MKTYEPGVFARLWDSACIGTVAAGVALASTYPFIRFTDLFRESQAVGETMLVFFKRTSLASLCTGSAQQMRRESPAAGAAFAINDAVAHWILRVPYRLEDIPSWKRRWLNGAAGGTVAGMVEGPLRALITQEPSPLLGRHLMTLTCARHALFRANYFGFHDALVPLTLVPSTEQGRTAHYTSRLVVSWYATLVALLCAQPLGMVSDAMAAAGGTRGVAATYSYLVESRGGVRGLWKGGARNAVVAINGAVALVAYDALRDLSPTL